MITKDDIQFQVKDDGATLGLVAYIMVRAGAEMNLGDRSNYQTDAAYKQAINGSLAQDILNHIYGDADSRLQQLDELCASQIDKWEWGGGSDEYMRGLANGLILAQSVLTDGEPVFIVAPGAGQDKG